MTYFITMTFEDYNVPITVVGIDTTKKCGHLSNIDLVHFVWQNFLRFSYKKYAMVLSPRVPAKLPKFLCLKHYRAESDGWKDLANCDDCVEWHMFVLNPFHSCDLSAECSCQICKRQPPSLSDSARHVLFNFTLHVDKFGFTSETTYEQYVYAIRCSNRVPQAKFLPPEAPVVRIWYRHDVNSPLKFHRDCPGDGSWASQTERTYKFAEEMIEDLITHKQLFWCHHCEKGLFFPNSCPVHKDGEEEEEIVDNEM